MTTNVVQRFEAWAQDTTQHILTWADPNADHTDRITKDWAFTRCVFGRVCRSLWVSLCVLCESLS